MPSASSADVRAFSDDHKGGDILIFLSGEREIREAAEALRKHHPAGTEILPLYARLSTEEQNRIFQPHAGRRIVLATNVAETSLTVPGIRYVIDLGFARISRYSANARVQRLPIEPVSRASSDQRKGRCGRLGPGVCIRLYSEPDYADRPEFTDPEILRANLAAVILQMKALRLGEIERFPFIDPPRPGMIREGYQTLLELGAVDDHGRLTRLGGELARLPVDPRIGRMILAAREEKCLAEALIIASALATQDARLRPMDAQGAADLAHQRFADESSDFLSYLKLWDFYHEQARHLSTNKLRKVCQQHYLSYVRMREWHDVHQQLHALATESGMRLNDQPAASENIHQALLTGLLNNVGLKTETHEYTGPRERKFNIFPGSGLFKKGPKWIMAAELVETNRLYARTVARIHPEWIERLAGHLLKRAHSEPHWNERSAHVEAFERITLHGLVIVPRRRVHFGAIDPAQAREIFIHQGLVEGQLQPPLSEAPFFQHNRALMQELRGLEAKTRRRNVMVNEEVIFNFYDRHVPAGVFNGPLLQKWRRQAERENPGVLFMARQDLTQPGAAEAEPDQFPDAINVSGVRLPLTYRLEPGDPADGVTMVIPIEALHQVGGERADWLVPGLLQEKIAALIKTLPKEIRRNFVPAPEYAELAAKSVPFGAGDMLEAVGEHLHRRVGVAIPRDAWRPDLLPDHLRMNYAVLDAAGQSLATGRDLNQIKRELEKQAAALRAAAAHSEFERRRITEWTFDDLPERVEIKRGGITIFGYPALIDDGDSVSIQLVDSAGLATTVGRAGLRRLFALQVRDELAVHIDYLPNIDDLCLLFAPLGGGEQLKADLIDLVADRVFIGEASPVRTQTEFERRLRSGWSNLWPAASELGELVGRILTAHHAIDLQLDDAINPLWNDAISDIRAQVGNLMPPRFLINTPQRWLSQYPRYLAAVQARLRKLVGGGLARDARATAQIAECWQRFEARLESHRVQRIHDPELELYRWMIEELRVSLFAQELGTAVPVSAKRLEAQWAKVRP